MSKKIRGRRKTSLIMFVFWHVKLKSYKPRWCKGCSIFSHLLWVTPKVIMRILPTKGNHSKAIYPLSRFSCNRGPQQSILGFLRLYSNISVSLNETDPSILHQSVRQIRSSWFHLSECMHCIHTIKHLPD